MLGPPHTMLDDRPATTTSEPTGSPRPGTGPAPAADHPALGPPPPGGRPGPRLTRRNRERAFDRAWRGGRLATFVGGTGRMLITVGLLILLFVAYQLWGTGIYTAQAQDDLKSDLKAIIASGPSTTVPDESTVATAPGRTAPPPVATATTTATTTAPTPTTVPPLPSAQHGDAVALIKIPEVGIDWAVVEGIGRDDLKKGPGHYPTTPWPGQLGNAAIAGHRTTYGAPFNRLDEFEVGDEITVTDVSGEFTYKVTRKFVVSPSDVTVLAPPDDPTAALLTLTTCHPKYSANQRLIIQAALVGTPLPPDAGQTTPVPPSEQPPANPSDNPVLATPTTVASAPGGSAPPPGASTPAPGAASAPPSPRRPRSPRRPPSPRRRSPSRTPRCRPRSPTSTPPAAASTCGRSSWRPSAGCGGTASGAGRTGTPGRPGSLPFLFVLFFFYRQLEGVLPAGY